MATVKETLIDTISALPDDASYDEIMRELAFQAMVTRGMEDIRQGRMISHEEMKRRLSAFKDWDNPEEEAAWAHLQPRKEGDGGAR